MLNQTRTESDSLGELQLPCDVYYGIQSERARLNFDVSGLTIGDYPAFIRAMAIIKKAAVLANNEIGLISDEMCKAVAQSADEVIAGKFENAFPIDVFQGGGYTSANMNMNEVIANRANEIMTGQKGYDVVHPNTHVNMGQSTNDVIPAALKLSTYEYIKDVVKSAISLRDALAKKAADFHDVVRLGRTCIQDAVPMTMGQAFGGYVHAVTRCIGRLEHVMPECLILPLGATAIGTQLSAGSGYVEAVYNKLTDLCGKKITKEDDLFDGLQNADIYVEVHAALKALAVLSSKIATDFRMLSSGPRAGLGELTLPAVQPGSSIMPGKINPVMPELINQICYQVCGNDVAVTMSVEGGELDLNVWEPSIFKNVAESCRLLSNGLALFTQKCVEDVIVNREVCKRYASSSTAISTVIATLFGYQKGSAVAKKAMKEDKTVFDVTVEEGILTKEEAEELLDPMLMAHPDQFTAKIDAYRQKHNMK